MDLDRRELQCILNAINENIFFKDTNGRYVLSTHVCNMLNSNGDSSFSIYGKTDLDIQPDKTLGKKFYEEDMNIIKTKNNGYYIGWKNRNCRNQSVKRRYNRNGIGMVFCFYNG